MICNNVHSTCTVNEVFSLQMSVLRFPIALQNFPNHPENKYKQEFSPPRLFSQPPPHYRHVIPLSSRYLLISHSQVCFLVTATSQRLSGS